MRKLLVASGIVLLLILGSFFLITSKQEDKTINTSPKNTVEESVKFKASFAIFTNGTYRLFDDPKYHNQSEDVYMEEANIVVVKKRGITWADFFVTLPMSLNKDCLTTGTGQNFCTDNSTRLRFFINGEEDPDALDKEINDGGKLLVTYGSGDIENQLKQVPDP